MKTFADLIDEGISESTLLDSIRETIQDPNYIVGAKSYGAQRQITRVDAVHVAMDEPPPDLAELNQYVVYTKDFWFGRMRVVCQSDHDGKQYEIVDAFCIEQDSDPLDPERMCG